MPEETPAVEVMFRSIGIGVSDLQKSTDFYIKVCGMQHVTTYNLPYMDENILSIVGPDGTPRGPRLVLMHWTDGSPRNYDSNPAKLVMQVSDAQAFCDRVRAEGYEGVNEPRKSLVSNNRVGFAKDPDGYLIEILQVVAS
ncbi:MAG: VOC family protein [Chloroflexi bacterium]|nr:VOC family protein [Chloroflexota bacterium]